MSGKIKILNADDTPFKPTANPDEKTLYSVHKVTPVDGVCGTSELEPYSFGNAHGCSERYICGKLDTNFEKCLDAMNCKMRKNMHRYTSANEDNKIAVFMQQMIPHHNNAINMAKLLMKQVAENDLAAVDEGGLTNILYDIINVQSFQVHQFRNYLGPDRLTPAPSTAEPTTDTTAEPGVEDVSSAQFVVLASLGLILNI
jgi:hypothetical protein